MYKKIEHNIVEEHFDHPAVLPQHMNTAVKASLNGSVLPEYVMNEATMQFRMDARAAWGKWVWGLLNYAISLNGNLPGADQVKRRLSKNAYALGTFIIPYYGLTAGSTLGQALIGVGDVGVEYVEAYKANKSAEELKVITDKWAALIAEVAKMMNSLNPAYWIESTLVDMFSNIVKLWEQQLAARAKGDLIADEIAIDTLDKLVITGVADHAKAGYPSVSDYFSKGIISQFPSVFAD